MIHTRAADDDTADVLAGFDGTVVLHCFSSPGLLATALERGCYVSFAGNVTYPKADDLRDGGGAGPGRPDPRRDRLPVPRAAAAPRPPERARERRATRSPRSPDARGEDAAELGAQIDANATRVPSALP